MGEFFDVEQWQDVLLSSLRELGTTVAGFLPNLVATIVILTLGSIISRVVGTLARRLFHKIGLDGVSERLGVSDALRKAGLNAVPSAIVGNLTFWVLMLTFLLSAAETLGLRAVTTTIDRLIGYLPNVIAAALIVVIGLLLARFIRNLVSSGAATVNLGYAQQLGGAAQGAVIVMVGVLTAQQLGVDTQLLLTVITTLVAGLSIAISLSFALGSRDVVRGILASHYLRQSLREGEQAEVDGMRGRIVRIGPVDTLFRNGDDSWSVPNEQLLKSVIRR